jgi:hypothetical protein
MTFEDGTDMLVATSLHCVKYQNAKDLVHGIFLLMEDL